MPFDQAAKSGASRDFYDFHDFEISRIVNHNFGEVWRSRIDAGTRPLDPGGNCGQKRCHPISHFFGIFDLQVSHFFENTQRSDNFLVFFFETVSIF